MEDSDLSKDVQNKVKNVLYHKVESIKSDFVTVSKCIFLVYFHMYGYKTSLLLQGYVIV